MNTKEKIAVMQAWVDGKDIQCRPNGLNLWDEVDAEPRWDWTRCEWRIKPEPREWIGYVGCDGYIYKRQQYISQLPVKVREVLE